MVNNTVKTGKAAGKEDYKTVITGMGIVQTEKDLETPRTFSRKGLTLAEYISITAYDGGNPNKKQNKENKEKGTGRSE